MMGALLIGFDELREFAPENRDAMTAITQQCALAFARTRHYEAERLARSNAEDAEARYRLLAESIPQIVWTAAPDGSVDYYNEQYYRFTGLAPGMGMGWDWVEAIHPDDRERAVEALRGATVTGESFQTEIRKRSEDGSYCWFLERALPLKDASGNVVRWLGTCTDIEDQKRSQESLEFLAEASSILSRSLDYEDALAEVCRLVVRDMADWCTVHVLNEDGTISYLAVANEDPELCRLAEEMEGDDPLPWTPLRICLRPQERKAAACEAPAP
jgi:PAS domain S-box-containing protein